MRFEIDRKFTKAGFESIQAKVDRINRKAARIGAEPIKIHATSELVDRKERDAFGAEITVQVELFTVEIEGEEPAFQGYSFLARIDHERMDSGYRNMVKKSPHCNVELPDYRTADPDCDHCNSKRFRKATYIVREEATSELKQLGSTCLHYFIPEGLVERLNWFYESVLTVGEDEDEGWGSFGGSFTEFGIDPKRLLALTSFAIRAYGWISRSRAWNEYTAVATADVVADWAFPPRSSGYDTWKRNLDAELAVIKARIGTDAPDSQDDKLAEDALAWIKSEMNPDANDYYNNVYVAFNRAEYVRYKDLGIACSGLVAYQKAMEQAVKYAEKRKSFADSQYLGVEKKRENWNGLKVEKIRYLESQWGSTTMYTFNFDGNMLVYYASRPLYRLDDERVAEGDTINLKATVKAHKDYNGIKQTILTRGVVV